MEEKEEIEFKREEPREISTATELYLLAREKMLSSPTEYEYYRNLVESIEIGASILGGEIAQRVASTLAKPGNYLEKFNISYQDRHVYQLSTGNEKMGKITCRPEELELAQVSIREQLSSQIISQLKPISNDIFNKLLIKKIIRVKTLEDEELDKLLVELDES